MAFRARKVFGTFEKRVPGPDGREKGSYSINLRRNSNIKFMNEEKYLEVRYSTTILCWLYHDFHYQIKGGVVRYLNGMGLYASEGRLKVKLRGRYGNITHVLQDSSSAGGWIFVGANYNNESGDVKLWIYGEMIHKHPRRSRGGYLGREEINRAKK